MAVFTKVTIRILPDRRVRRHGPTIFKNKTVIFLLAGAPLDVEHVLLRRFRSVDIL